MPTPTYTPLANITLGASAASVTFSSINQGFRDLVLVFNGSQETDAYIRMRFNSDTGANYNTVYMRGTGSVTDSSTAAGDTGMFVTPNATSPAGTRFQIVLSVMDYSATDKHKSVLIRYDKPDLATYAVAGRWASTSAITSLTIGANYLNMNAGTTLALYGIAA